MPKLEKVLQPQTRNYLWDAFWSLLQGQYQTPQSPGLVSIAFTGSSDNVVLTIFAVWFPSADDLVSL